MDIRERSSPRQHRPGLAFTGAAFTGVLADNIAISMDGKGAWRDNVFVERVWKSVKYEEVYLRAYETVGEAPSLIGRYSTFTLAAVRIRALTTAPRIKPTSIFLRSARRPSPGRRSAYRRGKSVQTTETTSLFPCTSDSPHASATSCCVKGRWKLALSSSQRALAGRRVRKSDARFCPRRRAPQGFHPFAINGCMYQRLAQDCLRKPGRFAHHFSQIGMRHRSYSRTAHAQSSWSMTGRCNVWRSGISPAI
jgi:hypothetical protein